MSGAVSNRPVTGSLQDYPGLRGMVLWAGGDAESAPMHTPNRRAVLATLAALPACSALPGTAPALAEDEALRAALAGAHRSAANRARDAARHPYETLRFFGIRPTLRVVELTPGGGWYTEILAVRRRRQRQLAQRRALR